MMPGFSDMAGGHGFREKPGERLRYRALHKVNDYKRATALNICASAAAAATIAARNTSNFL